MADNTPIEWADATVNAINGCSLASPGCTNCYAMRLAGTRLKNHPSREGLTMPTKTGPVWKGKVRLHEEALLQPLRWRRPRTIFWNAHGDTFHESVPDQWIDRVFAVAALTPHHQHLILTKRAARMREYVSRLEAEPLTDTIKRMAIAWPHMIKGDMLVTGPNLWLGVSVEDQQRANERIPDLLATPAAGRFLSCEPLLGPIDLPLLDMEIDGVIVGGENGPRPMHPDWVRSLRDQCAVADVDFHLKQWGSWLGDAEKIPFRADRHRPRIAWMDRDTGALRRHPQRGSDACMARVGKKAAGRTLDGVTHDALPWRRAA